MRRHTTIVVLAAVYLLSVGSALVCAQQNQQPEPSESKRKIVTRVLPEYPPIARLMNLKGVVKVEAVVGNDGTPRLVEVKGGHPVLAQAAVAAVRKWRWEHAQRETKEPVEVKFSPE